MRRNRRARWPAEMEIVVQTNDSHLSRLLFARAIWHLKPQTPVPSRLTREPAGSRAEPPPLPREELEARWAADWRTRIEALGEPSGADDEPSPASGPEAYRRWRADRQPLWDGALFPGFEEEAYTSWISTIALDDARARRNQERDATPHLVEAWRNGLRRIVVLPLDDDYAVSAGNATLIVSARIRDDTPRYSTILRDWSSGRR